MSHMPTVVVASDLHLGITKEWQLRELAERMLAEQPHLTVLGGDIGEGLENFKACLKLFADLPGSVAVLAGNHDVWARGHGIHSKDLWEHELPRATREAGMLWLEDAVWQEEGLAVTGSIGWYDYSAVDPTVPPYPPTFFAAEKHNYNLDAKYVDWPWIDGAFATSVGDALCGRLARLEADVTVSSIVVVTHVPLFDVQMARKPSDPRWGFSNAYFGNLTLGRRVAQFRKVAYVVSGHTHVGRSGVVIRPAEVPGGPIPALVLPSDYGHPAYHVVRFDGHGGGVST